MPEPEIYSNPCVERVIFEARYPSLFFLEAKIGDIQLQLMKQFPVSKLLFKKRFVMSQEIRGTPPGSLDAAPAEETTDKEPLEEKIWQFQNEAGTIKINIQLGRLDITSTAHTSYFQAGSSTSFSSVVKTVIGIFLATAGLHRFNRLGLRYTNKCPFPVRGTKTFKDYYNSSYPTDRFSIEETIAYDFISLFKRGEIQLRYHEFLAKAGTSDSHLGLDFDASALEVPALTWEQTTNSLHSLISEEFFKTIKEPVKVHMRKPKG